MSSTILQSMFHANPSNTWVFVGGEDIEGGYKQTGFIRNFIGQFEEYIRFTKTDSILSRQRFTINTGKSGYDIGKINTNFFNLIAQFNPKSVVYFVGREDFESLSISKFKEELYLFISKVLALRNEHAYCVLITPHAYTDLLQNQKACAYAQAMEELYQGLSLLQKKYTVLIPCYKETNTSKFLENCIQLNGCLNAYGHLFLAKLFTLYTFGSTKDFPVSDFDIQNFPGTAKALEILRQSIKNLPDTSFSSLQQDIRRRLYSSPSSVWLFIGDSITHGAVHTCGFDSIHQLFEKYIRETYNRKDDIVINTGVSGATTVTQLSHNNERLEAYPADFVVLLFGTNDASDALDALVPLSKFKKNLERLIESIRKKYAIPILRTPNPLPSKDYRALHLPDYVEVIREVAREQDILLADHFLEWTNWIKQYPYLWENGNWNNDIIHPNALGQIQMTQSFIKACGLWQEGNNYFNQL